MLTLSVNRKDTVFRIADAPRLADATSVTKLGNNTNNAVENGEDGLIKCKSTEMAVYYPHGLTTNLDGTNVMVPDHMALRTIAFNDSVASWFAPRFPRGSCKQCYQQVT